MTTNKNNDTKKALGDKVVFTKQLESVNIHFIVKS